MWADYEFRKGEERTTESARKGGIRSGEVRRAKAEQRKMAKECIGDLVYTRYLTDVTEEELREFIKFRGRNKRKATIARAFLEAEDAEETHAIVDEYLERKKFIVPYGKISNYRGKISGFKKLTFDDAIARTKGEYRNIMRVLGVCIDDFLRCAELMRISTE